MQPASNKRTALSDRLPPDFKSMRKEDENPHIVQAVNQLANRLSNVGPPSNRKRCREATVIPKEPALKLENIPEELQPFAETVWEK